MWRQTAGATAPGAGVSVQASGRALLSSGTNIGIGAVFSLRYLLMRLLVFSSNALRNHDRQRQYAEQLYNQVFSTGVHRKPWP